MEVVKGCSNIDRLFFPPNKIIDCPFCKTHYAKEFNFSRDNYFFYKCDMCKNMFSVTAGTFKLHDIDMKVYPVPRVKCEININFDDKTSKLIFLNQIKEKYGTYFTMFKAIEVKSIISNDLSLEYMAQKVKKMLVLI